MSGIAGRDPRKLGRVLIVCFVVVGALSWILVRSSAREPTLCHPLVYQENGVYRFPDPSRGCRLTVIPATRDRVGESFRGRYRKH